VGYEKKLTTTEHETVFHTCSHFYDLSSSSRFFLRKSFFTVAMLWRRFHVHVLLFILFCIASGFSSKSSGAMFRKTNLVGGEAPSAASEL
jgi:hypothetical protein